MGNEDAKNLIYVVSGFSSMLAIVAGLVLIVFNLIANHSAMNAMITMLSPYTSYYLYAGSEASTYYVSAMLIFVMTSTLALISTIIFYFMNDGFVWDDFPILFQGTILIWWIFTVIFVIVLLIIFIIGLIVSHKKAI